MQIVSDADSTRSLLATCCPAGWYFLSKVSWPALIWPDCLLVLLLAPQRRAVDRDENATHLMMRLFIPGYRVLPNEFSRAP